MLSTREKLELFKGRLGNIRAKKLDAGSSSMTQPKMVFNYNFLFYSFPFYPTFFNFFVFYLGKIHSF